MALALEDTHLVAEYHDLSVLRLGPLSGSAQAEVTGVNATADHGRWWRLPAQGDDRGCGAVELAAPALGELAIITRS